MNFDKNLFLINIPIVVKKMKKIKRVHHSINKNYNFIVTANI